MLDQCGADAESEGEDENLPEGLETWIGKGGEGGTFGIVEDEEGEAGPAQHGDDVRQKGAVALHAGIVAGPRGAIRFKAGRQGDEEGLGYVARFHGGPPKAGGEKFTETPLLDGALRGRGLVGGREAAPGAEEGFPPGWRGDFEVGFAEVHDPAMQGLLPQELKAALFSAEKGVGGDEGGVGGVV